MVHRLTRRFTSFLDRFEERLEVDCEQLKRQLVSQVDQQFGAVRSKVTELKNRFGVDQARSARSLNLVFDDPPGEIVSLDQWMQEQCAAASIANIPTASNGTKRKNAGVSQSVSKRQKLTVSNKYKCNYSGCGKIFRDNYCLTRHERIHLGIKPFSCTWPNCRHSSARRSHVIRHVRTKHFKFPPSKKAQEDANIVGDRNPVDYVRVDTVQAKRRLC